MPVCDALYTKAIETLPDAPLSRNRSGSRWAFDGAKERRHWTPGQS